MIKRVAIYPTLRQARLAFRETAENLNHGNKPFKMNGLELRAETNSERVIFTSMDGLKYFRGHRFNAVYVHEDVDAQAAREFLTFTLELSHEA